MLVTVSWPDNHPDNIDTYVEDPRPGGAADLRRLPKPECESVRLALGWPGFPVFSGREISLKFGC